MLSYPSATSSITIKCTDTRHQPSLQEILYISENVKLVLFIIDMDYSSIVYVTEFQNTIASFIILWLYCYEMSTLLISVFSPHCAPLPFII